MTSLVEVFCTVDDFCRRFMPSYEASLGACCGISYLDSTALAVRHNRRIAPHRVFAGLAARGRTSVGWFYGFKLHLVCNDRGDLLNVALTPGSIDDRQPVRQLVRQLFGKLFGDQSCLSHTMLGDLLQTLGRQLIIRLKANLKNWLLPLAGKVLPRKRATIETLVDQLKSISQIEHSRHRRPVNFVVAVLGGLIAYCPQSKKPPLSLDALARLPV
jgi:hypothetical protein